MSWTKRQFVEQAFEEIGYASYVFDLQPEQLQVALRRLDGLLASWNGRGIRLGYPLPSSPQLSDLDEDSNVPDAANEAIYLNLAIRLAPTVGKTVSMETKRSAKLAYTQLLSRHTQPRADRPLDRMPLGAGNKPWRRDRVFTDETDDSLLAGDDGPIDFT